nr:PAS domain S-box protein [Polyangium spumosum]
MRRRVAELERREVEALARISLYEQVLDALPDLVEVKDHEQRIVHVNRAYREHHGARLEELVGKTEAALGRPDAPLHAERDAQVLSGIFVDIPSTPVPRRDGRAMPFHVVCAPLRDEQNRITGIVQSARPIRGDEMQGSDQQTERGEAHNRALLRVIPDMYFLLDREGTYVDFSAGRGMDTALPPALFLGKRVKDVTPDLAQWAMACVDEALRTGDLVRHEFRLFAQGKWIDYEARAFATGPEHTLFIVRDISAAKLTERQLREAEARDRAFEEQSMFGVFMLQGSRLVYVNPKLAEMLGQERRALLGDDGLTSLVMKDERADLGAFLRSIERAAEGSEEARGQLALRACRKDGAPLFLETFGARVTFGDAPAVIGVVLDVTARREAEEQQRRLQDELIRMQEMMVVEMSTPLIPITDQIVVMPLIGSLDDRRAEQVMGRLLSGVSGCGARVVIMDITGLSSVTTQTASALVRCAQAARLLGATVLLTGMRADVAQTLVEMDVDLSGVVTLGTLKAGIAHAMRRTGG